MHRLQQQAMGKSYYYCQIDEDELLSLRRYPITKFRIATASNCPDLVDSTGTSVVTEITECYMHNTTCYGRIQYDFLNKKQMILSYS